MALQLSPTTKKIAVIFLVLTKNIIFCLNLNRIPLKLRFTYLMCCNHYVISNTLSVRSFFNVITASDYSECELHYEECIQLSELVPSASDGVPDGACDTTMNVFRPFP